MTRPRLVVLDRDGVINEDSGEFIKSVAEWRPIEGSLEAIAALTRAGFRVAVVTKDRHLRRTAAERTRRAARRGLETAVDVGRVMRPGDRRERPPLELIHRARTERQAT